MGPLSYGDAIALIVRTLNEIGAYSTRAELAIMMIIAHESGRGRYRKQLGGGPARGLIQMEPPTFDSVIKYGEKAPQYLRRAGYDPRRVKCADLEYDDKLAIVMARARLAMDPAPLPHDPAKMAEYLKAFWNGPGEATPDEYLNDWKGWRDAYYS